MATVAVSIKDFRSGTLPRICVKTGPAVANPDITANREIGWTWVLLLFGILPFLHREGVLDPPREGPCPHVLVYPDFAAAVLSRDAAGPQPTRV